jgi:hypothetical protein
MVHNFTFDPTSPNVLYAATEAGVYSLPHVWTGTLANTTWLSGETYLVEGILTVPEGVELVVEQGAEVRFSSGARLDVKGTLEVNGTSGSLATFTRDGSSGSWSGIVAENSAFSPTVDLNYARIEYCTTGLRIGNNATFSMANCTVDNVTVALEITPIGTQDPVTQMVTNNTFSNLASGVLVTNTSDILFDNNTITASSLEELPTGISLTSSSPKILRTTIQGFARGLLCLGASSPVLEDGTLGGNNRIRYNATGVRCKDYSNANLGIKGTGDIGG